MKVNRRVLAVCVGVAAALSLGACSSGGANPGTAVESLGVRYTENDLTVATDELTSVMGQQLDRTSVVSFLALAQPYMAMADQVGVSLDDDQFTQPIDQLLETSGASRDGLSQATMDVLNAILLSQVVGASVQADPELNQDFAELIAQTHVNPRYMSLSMEAGAVPAGPLADVVPLGQGPSVG